MKVLRVVAWGVGAVVLVVVGIGLVAYVRSDNVCSEPPARLSNPMKAVVYCDYGSPRVLRLQDVEKPVPAENEVLVRVRAAAVNPLDWHYMRGTPYIARLEMGLRKPKNIRLGVDFAGVVEAVGRKVTQFKPGDAVFGAKTGALAQYLAARADRIVAKPANLTFEEAAAVPVAGLTALQAVRDQGKVQPGQKVLVNGASGGVGTFAVQIAKVLGAQVTGVSSTRNLELVRSIGADHVIDYTKENFTETERSYDLIIDNVGNHSLSAVRRSLNPRGTYVLVGAPKGKWLDPLPRAARAALLSRFTDQDLRFFISQLNQKDLTTLRDLLAAGRIKVVIDRQYPLEQTAQAIGYLETGRARGKVIVVVDSLNPNPAGE